jgi:hypothetical protein
MPLFPRYFAFHGHHFLKPFFIFLALIVLLEFLGNFFGLFRYPSLGFDKVLHFLGGVTCGIFGIGILAAGFSNSPCERKTVNRRIWIMAIITALFIGVIWEIAQVYLPWLRDFSDHNLPDTIGDIIFDTIGGIGAGLCYQIKE